MARGSRLFPTLRILAALVLLCAGAAMAGDEAAPGSPITGEELAARIAAGDAPLILDVRTPAEYEAGHLPDARNVPHGTLADRLAELGIAEDAEIVVHCQSGRRAADAEEVLREAGYTNVRDLTGHWLEWERSGRPTQ
jgi:rhodanese-related sulfurtransferase